MTNLEKQFNSVKRPHILMITNHGMHHWRIVPGLPDTGGQNVFVNQFSQAMAQAGFKISIINRGGYANPVNGETRRGMLYKDAAQRIIYLEDGRPEFVRKEDMDAQLPALLENLQEQVVAQGNPVDCIISHYWDGAKLGVLYNRTLDNPVRHIWVPHSLGAVKKRNVQAAEWENLRIDERIANERAIISAVDRIASTSSIIAQSLKQDYGYTQKLVFLPPCVDPQRYSPHALPEDHPIWDFLAEKARIPAQAIRDGQLITEISRTDDTKRKNILLRAFAHVKEDFPRALLVLTIDEATSLGKELMQLIDVLHLKERVIVLGSVWEQLPDIYAASAVYCTPSVMEGFGMSPQEAAASRVPVVSSDLVPYVGEYLLGADARALVIDGKETSIRRGAGALVVPADDVEGFASALRWLLDHEDERQKMAEAAYRITIPYFTWTNIVREFLRESGLAQPSEGTQP
ncbi:MAG: hypothetical protein PWQ55_1442 [Chloroflexota bacterium]|nr:hypothetical protein [Chloroflexota bacterium]